jgi:hypothetical protein
MCIHDCPFEGAASTRTRLAWPKIACYLSKESERTLIRMACSTVMADLILIAFEFKIIEQNGRFKNLQLCPVSHYWLFAFSLLSLLHRHNRAEC